MSVRERNELHASGSERVETWQLPAAGRQRQRKRLNAVTEEIPPGQNIARVEVLVQLCNEAGQIIKRRRDHRGLPGGKIGGGPGMQCQQLRDHRI